MKRSILTILALATLAISVNAEGVPQQLADLQKQITPTYAVTDVGVLPGFTQMIPMAINIQGDVVGYAIGQLGQHAFLYSDGKLIDLGMLIGPTESSWAVGINAEREIIGNFDDASGGVHGFVYWNGRLKTFDIPTNGITYLRAINDIGQIVGNSGYASSLTGYSFLRQPNGTIVKLPNFEGGIFEAEAINNLGQIAGTVWLANPVPGPLFYVNHAVLMQAGGSAPRDLGSLGGPADASALNIWGQVVGYSLETYNYDPYAPPGEPFYGVLYAGGKVTNLGLPSDEVSVNNIFESYATGINDYGQIVGFSDLTYSGQDPHGVVYLKGQMYDLNDLIGTASTSYTIAETVGINDLGQIVGTAVDASGNEHAVILTVVGGKGFRRP